MLLRRLCQRFFSTRKQARTSQTFRKASNFVDSDSLRQMRNIDYKQLRKNVVDQYNKGLKRLSQDYQKQVAKKQASGEGSEEEAGLKFEQFYKEYRRSVNQLYKSMADNLKQIDEQERTNTVKIYLTENIKQESNSLAGRSTNDQQQFFIPKGFIVKKLYLCTQKKAQSADVSQQLLLAGVQKEEDHCLFLMKLIQDFEIKNIVTMIPPDLPYFIKTEQSFIAEWQKFIQDTDYAKKSKFFVNPKPRVLDDICLHAHHFPLVRSALANSSSFIETHYALLKENEISRQFQYTPLLSGICSQTVNKVYMADYPAFQERKMLADSMSLHQLRDFFQEHLANVRKLRLNFSAQWLFPKQILTKKLRSVVNIARAVASRGEGRTILVCPAEIAQLVGIEWQLGLKSKSGPTFSQKGEMLLSYNQGVHQQHLEQTFIEHIEKLVILDLIMDPVITRYFVKYRSFPFLCEHTIGGKENIGKIFIVWMHFYNIYYQRLTERTLQTEDKQRKRKQYLRNFEDPTNFT